MPLCFEFDAPPKHNLDAQMMQRKIPCDLRIECDGKIVNIRMMLYYHEIEKRCGVKIPTIFEMEGEDGFRKREASVIKDLVSLDNIVLATGGGSVLLAENRENLKQFGYVIYLRANPHDLWLRTRHDKSRPLLNTPDPQKKFKELFAIRDPLYTSIAHQIVDTGRPNVSQLTNQLVMQLELMN